MLERAVVWGPGIGGPILLVQLSLVLISAARLVNSARRLYQYSSGRISAEDVVKGGVDPDLLAASGLANRLPCRDLLQKRVGSEFLRDETGAVRPLYILGVAESRFLYFWKICRADVDSARRAALLTFTLSMVALAYSALPIYFLHFNNSNQGGASSTFWTVQDLLVLLGHGWSCCAVLYLASSFFERALVRREICWKYFCARVKSELPPG
jgi:hypothetical protein